MKMLDSVVRISLNGGLPKALFIFALLVGAMAFQFTAREEEPQIVVPMVEVLVEAPGLSAAQVERQVTTPLEKLIAQIPGVEHVYSTSATGMATATLRFYVGQNREESILNTYNKLYSNQDQIPGVVSRWMVRPVEVDDVPIMLLALWSSDPDRYSDYELRRLAEDLSTRLQGIARTSEVNLVGGRPRTLQVLLDPEALAARSTTPIDVANALRLSNQLRDAGIWTHANQAIELQAGDAFRSADDLGQTLVNLVDGAPVMLQEVARLVDGPDEAASYTWIDFAPAHPRAAEIGAGRYPMVSISVAKQRGSNAVAVAREVHDLIAELKRTQLPPQIDIEVIRDYGQTADEKVNNLASSLGFAILTVVIFLGIFLGWRAALVVGLALPICYGITLALDMAFGYTINRVTLFALILSLGLLVDDPITGVDNITRKMKEGVGSLNDRIIDAMAEIRTPLLMSTLTIALAFIPLAFISGMMGPYMAPMAFNVPVAVVISTLVAFVVTPWLSSRLLKQAPDDQAEYCEPLTGNNAYRQFMSAVLDSPRKRKLVLWAVLALFIGAAMLPMLRMVPLKLLPFDNKNEVQILIDMPRSSSLEQTAAMAQQVSVLAQQLPEITAVAAFVGEPSAMDFNGMVRQYYQRVGPHLADLRLTLVDKADRQHQSHGVVLRLRELLAPLNSADVKIKVVEVPPGPPVLSTLVVEIYADPLTPYALQEQAAQSLMQRMAREPHLVEVDSSMASQRQQLRFVADKIKAALSGISTADINQTLAMANAGEVVGYVQEPRESTPLPVVLRLAPEQRSSLSDLQRLQVKGIPGIVQEQTSQGLRNAAQPLVAIGELGEFVASDSDPVILHKDLKPVVYVTAELNGRTPAEVISDLNADRVTAGEESPTGEARNWHFRSFLIPGGGDQWSVPEGIRLSWTGEGEWRITKDVFRDMGLAFAFALAAIFVVLRLQTASTALSLIIMSAIPLTVIGIMPGFWLLNMVGEREIAGAPDPVLFTATAMIGMIALAGIVVRNSLILIEFINQARAAGLHMKEALLQCGAVRMRPILLTAGTTLLGNLVIALDPVFSGLALAIIFGIIASTLFTLVVVPVAYLLVFGDTETPIENRSVEA